jgi:predicted metallopeptidase
MTPANIIRELERLPVTDKLFVIERTLKSIRTEKGKGLKAAVDNLYEDYKLDKELTVFTQLDIEPFYETR